MAGDHHPRSAPQGCRPHAAQRKSGRRSPRRYLLSSLLRCGKCGNNLFSSARENTRRYVCLSGPDHGGCGRLTVVAQPVETLVAAGVLHRLDTPELADALAGRVAKDEALSRLTVEMAEDQSQLAELATAYGAKQITMREWLAAKQPIDSRLETAAKRISRATRSDALCGLPGNGQGLRDSWDTLNLTRQAAIIAAVMDHAVIGPGSPVREAWTPPECNRSGGCRPQGRSGAPTCFTVNGSEIFTDNPCP